MGNCFSDPALDSPRMGGNSMMQRMAHTKVAPAIHLLKTLRMCSNSFLPQTDVQIKYHRIQGVCDRLVMDIHHGFFRTFYTDCVWCSPSDSLQCDLRKGMENNPIFAYRCVVGHVS